MPEKWRKRDEKAEERVKLEVKEGRQLNIREKKDPSI